MDPENNLSRVERTLWTVWCYITEAVSRFIRTQSADIVNNDPDSNQESAADIKHPHSDSADGDTCSGGVDEEQPVTRSSLLSSSCPVVTWEHCNTEIGSRSDEESMQHKTKLRKGDESKEDGEEMREEHHSQTENDHSNDLRAKEDKQEMMDMEKLHTCAELATPENDVCERVDTGPQNLKEVAISEERTEGESSAEKETARSVTSDDHPVETQVKEENDQMHNKEEPDLEAEDTEVAEEDDKIHSKEEQEAENTELRVCIITNLHPEEEEHMHEVEAELQKNDAVTLDNHPGKDDIIKETQLKEDEDKTHHDNEQDLGAEDTEEKVCIITSLSPEDDNHMHQGEAEALKTDTVTLDEHPREDENIKETQLKEEDDQVQHEDEQDLKVEDTEENDKTHSEEEQEASNTEVKVCIITSVSLEEEAHIHEVGAELQKNDAVTLDEHPREDETIKETQLKEEDDQIQHEEEHELEAEDTEVKVCIITSVSPEEEDHMHQGEAEALKKDTVTLDDHPREDETIKETKEKEDEDKTHHEDEKDLEAEDAEVKVCIITSVSPEEDDHIHEGGAEAQKKDAGTLDDHPREDETIKETQLKEEDDQMHHEEEQDLEVEDTEENDKTHSGEEQEASNTEVKVCIITSVSPEEEAHIHEVGAELQKNDAGTLDEHPREDETIKETQLKEEDDQMHHEEEQDLKAETDPVGLHMQEIEAEARKSNFVTLDDHPREDETIKETKEKEDEDKTHHEDEKDFEAEDAEVKVCIITSVSPEDDDHIHEGGAEAQKKDAGTLDDHPREDKIIKEIEEKEEADQMQHEEKQTFDVMLQLAPENVKKSDELTNQALFGDLPDASVVKPILVGQYPLMAHRSESDEGEQEKAGETEQYSAFEKENINEATASKTIEVSEQDKNIRTVAEGSEGQNVLTEYDACSKEAAQESITLLHTAEFTDEEKEDTRVQAVQTKTGQTGVTIADISVDERLVDQEKKLSISREAYTKECSKETVHPNASVTVKPEGETAQETSEEFKNIPLEISEGQFAMLQELNTLTCEEIQEGVSKYNNELLGVDENTTQRFLEAGDCEEIPASQLPEEVESGERESLQNSGWSTGADYLLLKESMEEKQESKEETETSFDFVGEEHSEILGLARDAEKTLVEGAFQESGYLLGKEEGNLLAGSMKTEVTEGYVGVGDETERRSAELHDGTKRSSFSKEVNATGSDCETKEAVAATEVVRFVIQESIQAINLVQSISGPSSLQEDTSESEFGRHSVETEPKSVDDSTVEMQDKAINREEGGRGDEEEEAEDGITKEMENLHLQVTETAGELITEESHLNAESELSQDSEPQEIENQSPDKACEISATQIIETETADESRPKDLPVTSSEVKSSSTNGHQDVIDEEILDLWIETVMSEGTDDIKQEEPEPGQLLDAKTDTLNEERGDLSLQKELLAESISGESEVVSDTGMSSSTVESGFLDQSLSESGTLSSEPQLLKSTSTGSLQWIHDMVASMSADIPGVAAQPQPQSETLNALMEESSEPEKESLMDTGVQSPEGRHLDEESQEKAGEERVERVETESGSPKVYEDVGEVVKKVEAEEECLNSSDELKPTELEQPESDTQGETRTESEKNTLNLSSLDGPQPGQCEDIADPSVPGLNKAEVAEEPTVKSGDENEERGDLSLQKELLTEVDAPVLDFAMQRSRIAVKNPRVRKPKNARSLLHMPSAEPTPTPSLRLPVKIPGGVPLGGMGIGIKLPGLGAGLPVLKKRQPAVREENSQETVSQEPERKPEEKSEAPQQDETPKKPKWMPPKHPGFGNPLMAELKTKLKKTPKE